MEGIRIETHGGPEVLTLRQDLPVPEPGPEEVRLRVRAVGLNHLDLWVRRGVPGHRFPLPLVPGSDIVGTVDDGADDLSPETRYLVMPGSSCMQCGHCRAGRHELCRRYEIFGESRDGGCARYVVVPRRNLYEIPDHLSWEQAAAVPLAFLTAWHMLISRAALCAGETVLVQAGASGVGSAAIQIALDRGARVIATAGTDEKLDFAAGLGAQEVLNYRTCDLVKDVRGLAGRGGVDVIVDHVGEATWRQDLALLAKGGRLVLCGATTGAEVDLDLRPLFFKSWSILGSTMGNHGDMEAVLDGFRRGTFRSTLDRVLPLRDIAEAHRLLEERQVIGKLVLAVE